MKMILIRCFYLVGLAALVCPLCGQNSPQPMTKVQADAKQPVFDLDSNGMVKGVNGTIFDKEKVQSVQGQFIGVTPDGRMKIVSTDGRVLELHLPEIISKSGGKILNVQDKLEFAKKIGEMTGGAVVPFKTVEVNGKTYVLHKQGVSEVLPPSAVPLPVVNPKTPVSPEVPPEKKSPAVGGSRALPKADQLK